MTRSDTQETGCTPLGSRVLISSPEHIIIILKCEASSEAAIFEMYNATPRVILLRQRATYSIHYTLKTLSIE
jgi:hypothetical protein